MLISYEQSDRVIDDPRVKDVALTGSVAAGRSVAARAGQNLKKSTMALGGSEAFIVLDDADLDQVIPWAVWGRMFNAGQTCCPAKRFIVLDAVAHAFLARFKPALEALKPGDPMDEKTRLGPPSTEAALVQLLAMIDHLVAADGGNPDPTTTHGKRVTEAKAIQEKGWDYPKHLACWAYGAVVHGDVAGLEAHRRNLTDRLDWMGLVDAGAAAKLDRYSGYYGPYYNGQ